MPHYHKTKFKCAGCQKEQSFMVKCGTKLISASEGPECIFCQKKELVCLGWDDTEEYPVAELSPIQEV